MNFNNSSSCCEVKPLRKVATVSFCPPVLPPGPKVNNQSTTGPAEERPCKRVDSEIGPSSARTPSDMLGAAAFLLAVGLGVGGGAAAFVALEGGPKACQDSFGQREGAVGGLQDSPRPT